jgi:hypothetical protein
MADDEREESTLDKVHDMHDSGVGTSDPNIAPDATPRIMPVDEEHSDKLLP